MQFILEDFDGVYEDLYLALEKLNETKCGHELVITADSADEASKIVCDKLKPFFAKYFEEYFDEEDDIEFIDRMNEEEAITGYPHQLDDLDF